MVCDTIPGGGDMNRRRFLQGSGLLVAAGVPKMEAAPLTAAEDVRKRWVMYVEKTAGPVLTALSERRLKQVMPVECKPGQEASRRQCTYLEALGRTLSGIAPWLESGSEGALREKYCGLAREAIAAGVDPVSADYMTFGSIAQTVVDAAFLGLGILRAPKELADKLPAKVKAQLIDGLKKTRAIKPPVNNWLLFAATVEATLERLGAEWEHAPVEIALQKHKEWYVGDGVYGDGPQFHADYYDSFVIHPFMRAVLESPVGKIGVGPELAKVESERAMRYAAIQERMIARDGTWPVVGRSIAYRCGAFHLLADAALREELPEAVRPAQVRGALTAAMGASLGARGSFDKDGWLATGLAGHQPSLGESYISTGSLYLCLNAFLPLGLGVEKPFWKDGSARWTAQKAWSGEDIAADHAL
jgi:hypothetical protein